MERYVGIEYLQKEIRIANYLIDYKLNKGNHLVTLILLYSFKFYFFITLARVIFPFSSVDSMIYIPGFKVVFSILKLTVFFS